MPLSRANQAVGGVQTFDHLTQHTVKYFSNGKATARGLAARPCNEAVEIVDHERALGRPASHLALLNDITGDSMWQPTFVFYMGYATLPANASPRRPAQAVLL